MNVPMLIPVVTNPSDTGVLDFLLRWAQIDNTWELWLVAFGIFAQTLFALRWLVQWIATERHARSVIPESFWWISLAGASTLLVYFTIRGEPVGLLGQVLGWVVYVRNLYHIRRAKKAPGA